MGWGNESLFAGSGSCDQDGRHAHIWYKPFKNLLLQNQRANDLEAWFVALGNRAHHICSMMTLGWHWPILQQGQIWSLMLSYGEKLLESHLMEETYSKWPEWQKVYVYIKILTPGGCLPLHRGYICIKTGTNMYKSRLQRYFFETCNKWAKWQGLSVDIRILSTKGCLPLPWGNIKKKSCGKTLKNVYKIRIQRDLFETCNKWLKW